MIFYILRSTEVSGVEKEQGEAPSMRQEINTATMVTWTGRFRAA